MNKVLSKADSLFYLYHVPCKKETSSGYIRYIQYTVEAEKNNVNVNRDDDAVKFFAGRLNIDENKAFELCELLTRTHESRSKSKLDKADRIPFRISYVHAEPVLLFDNAIYTTEELCSYFNQDIKEV